MSSLSINNVVLGGNLTRDPEPSATKNGTSVSKFGLAVNEWVKGESRANFFNVVCYGKTADVANQYLVKGSATIIVGRARFESWEKDGQKRSMVLFVAERLQLVGGKGEGGEEGGGKFSDDDITF